MKHWKRLLMTTLALFALGHGISQAFSGKTVQIQELSPLAGQSELTPIQKSHSKLYKQYNEKGGIPKVLKMTKDEPGDIEIFRIAHEPYYLAGISAPQDIINDVVCSADTVLVGTVKTQQTLVTQEQSYIFTDYEIVVEEVIKSKGEISASSEIIVTRPGGTVTIDNRKVTATDELFRPLQVGERYLLFLKELPETGTYKAVHIGFYLKGDKVKELWKSSVQRFETDYDASLLINAVRIAAGANCGKGEIK